MNQDQIAETFRSAELTRRQMRRNGLIQQMERELALADEPMSDLDRRNHKRAIARLRKIETSYLREIGLGYWRKLWLAICGRI